MELVTFGIALRLASERLERPAGQVLPHRAVVFLGLAHPLTQQLAHETRQAYVTLRRMHARPASRALFETSRSLGKAALGVAAQLETSVAA